ncbi:hypothetical protein NQ317_005329 [Molorchus minor]|uniref:Peptidase A1 domain-containing protein n=1 Tax=Molorchus minor TaxID=1323400 RepID=A0ABQ9JEJ8_9CUCU|nr:hypothetical protein NQ317_005329 [Molorchus minor]
MDKVKNCRCDVDLDIHRPNIFIFVIVHGAAMIKSLVVLFCAIFTVLGIEDNGTIRIELVRQKPNEFYGKIVIGHPGQTLNVAFDTAWSLSWVLSSKCQIWKTIGCWFHPRYDHTRSSEWKKDNRPFSINEGKYNFFRISRSNVTTQSFVEMVDVPWTFIFNKIDGSYLSIYLNRDRQSNKGGNIMLGFFDEKHIHKTELKNKTIVPAKITYLPVDPGQYWKFSVDSPTGCKAMADSSSNTISGPPDDIQTIHNAIKAQNFILNRYTVNCDTINTLPKVDFVLGGQYFRLEGPDYIMKMTIHSFTFCISAFVPASTESEENVWVLGGAFLAQYYSIYNINDKLIGFVKAA